MENLRRIFGDDLKQGDTKFGVSKNFLQMPDRSKDLKTRKRKERKRKIIRLF